MQTGTGPCAPSFASRVALGSAPASRVGRLPSRAIAGCGSRSDVARSGRMAMPCASSFSGRARRGLMGALSAAAVPPDCAQCVSAARATHPR